MTPSIRNALFSSLALLASSHAATLKDVKHIVILYQENWSFDGLLGKFPGADNLDSASLESKTQLDSNGTPYAHLPMVDTLHFGHFSPDNGPWDMTGRINADSTTIDLVHRFYQNQWQIDGGKNNRFAAGSDAKGLAMSHVDASDLPLGRLGKQGVVCDHFFQSAFGGSFLNHQWLVAAASPKWLTNAPQSKITRFDVAGKRLNDGFLTPDSLAVNTVQPTALPYSPGTADSVRLPPIDAATIATRLDAAKVSWKWYAGGWDSAMVGHGGRSDILFQYHHQPFVYFKPFADPASDYRTSHLQDETKFFADISNGHLPSVSWVKPMGAQNEHPGYTTLVQGMYHIKAIVDSLKAHPSIWDSTVVIITYDEFGGRFDHVAPPVVDRFGPGTRIPAVIVSPFAKVGVVDKTSYETVSTLAFIERRWNLTPLTDRDAKADPLSNAFLFSVPAGVAPGSPAKHHQTLSMRQDTGSLVVGFETLLSGDVQLEAVTADGVHLAGTSLASLSGGVHESNLHLSGNRTGLVILRLRCPDGEQSQLAWLR